jgi:beta-lactamase class A
VIDLDTFLAEQKNKTIAVAVHDLETGREILVDADEAFHPASTIKVHVMMEVFRQVEQGSFALANQTPITNSFTSVADGSKFWLSQIDDAEQTLYSRIGESESIAELMRLMIVRSSNLATNILLEKLGTRCVNDFIHSLGIAGVSVIRGIEDSRAFRLGLNNSASARGLTQTLRLIAEGKVVSQQACEAMIAILLDQEFNESIPALLPATVRVAHKTGWTGDVFHDTGIVYPQTRKPYVISIMTRGFSEQEENEAHTCMAKISRIVYETLQ